MKNTTLTTAKFNKLLEKIHKLKVELLNTNYWSAMCDIDERATSLFEIYTNNKIDYGNSSKKQQGYFKYMLFIQNKIKKKNV